MLTADLVRVGFYRDEVRPRYVDVADPDLLALAERLIATFAEHVGRSRGDLMSELRELLGTGTEFLLHRGLAKLLWDRCELATESAVEPEELRRRTFAAAAAVYAGESLVFDRDAIVNAVVADSGCPPDDFERSLYADLKDEQVVTSFREVRPAWLLRRYNVALAQGVLLRASELAIEVGRQPARKQRALFRKIKFHRLLYRARRSEDDGYRIVLDGPMSLFRSSQRYGVQMASFLPTLLHFDDWRLEAELSWGKQRRRKFLRLSPASGLEPIGRLTGQWQPEELVHLPKQLAALDSPWKVSRDAALVDLGGEGVLVPDLMFRHRDSGQRVFLEVLGYWRKGELDARLRLLRRYGPDNLLLAVSKRLVADEADLDDLPGEVYLFRSTPIARRLLERLESFS